VAVEGGHQARNPGQQWLTRFDGRGFVTQPDAGGWQWGLELESYGFAGQEKNVGGNAQVKTEGQRVTYTWGEKVREWFVNDQRAGAWVHDPGAAGQCGLGGSPAGVQPARARGSACGNRSGGRSVRFVDATGASVVNYARLKVWDADGQILPARFAAQADQSFPHQGRAVRISVDERGRATRLRWTQLPSRPI